MKDVHQLRLIDEHLQIEEVTNRGYFLIACITSFATDKLYVEDILLNENYYMEQFSKRDYGVIKHFLGGLKAFELGNFYTLKVINYENNEITVINKQTLAIEKWKLSNAINADQYSQLDKQSIFQLACFYSEQQILENYVNKPTNETIPEQLTPEDSIYSSPTTYLRLVKTSTAIHRF